MLWNLSAAERGTPPRYPTSKFVYKSWRALLDMWRKKNVWSPLWLQRELCQIDSCDVTWVSVGRAWKWKLKKKRIGGSGFTSGPHPSSLLDDSVSELLPPPNLRLSCRLQCNVCSFPYSGWIDQQKIDQPILMGDYLLVIYLIENAKYSLVPSSWMWNFNLFYFRWKLNDLSLGFSTVGQTRQSNLKLDACFRRWLMDSFWSLTRQSCDANISRSNKTVK